MSAPWLHVVGIGADGIEGLSPGARDAVFAADVLVGGKRHHALTAEASAERVSWPTPFDALVDTLKSRKGQRVAVLATGDPLWFSVGEKLATAFPPSEMAFHPHVSAFQLAAARMGWSLCEVETLSAHGRPVSILRPYLAPSAKLLVLTSNAQSPAEIAAFLEQSGYGASTVTVLSDLAMNCERILLLDDKDEESRVSDLNTVAIHCLPSDPAAVMPRSFGLPDDAFEGDGTMTKRDIRAVTLAKLMPMPNALLWDVGAGCGSVGIEWMRAARNARAIALEPRADRRDYARRNADALGTPTLEIIEGTAPDALTDLAPPDAIFIGGGLSEANFDHCYGALKRFGRLVANAVTLESEALLIALHKTHGGDLTRLAVQHADQIGSKTGWRPQMPVTQLSLVKS